VVAPLAPAAGGWAAHLQGIAAGQALAQGDQAHAGLGGLAEQGRQKLGPLKPPVAEEFGIEGRHQQGPPLHRAGQPRQLLGAALQVGGGVLFDARGGHGGLVGLLLVERAALGCHPVQLEPQGPAAGDGMAGQLRFG
jgi:hypothetical protein